MASKQKKTGRKRTQKRISAKLDAGYLEAVASGMGYGYGQFMSIYGSKIPYTTIHNAERIVERREKAGSGTLRVYRCPICQRRHITHTRYRVN